MQKDIEQLRTYLSEGKKTVVLTGSGISTGSGIPTLEDINKLKLAQFMLPGMLKLRPETAYSELKKIFIDPIINNGPSLSHRKLVELENEGIISGIITNNLDHLHTIAGSKTVAEIQGSFAINRCDKCGKHDDRLEIWTAGNYPHCASCKGLMLPFPLYTLNTFDEDAVAEANPSAVALARELVREADYLLVIGSKGFFAKYLDDLNPDARYLQINPGRTGFTRPALLNIKAGADEVLAQL